MLFGFTKNCVPSYLLGTIYTNDFASEVPYVYFTYVWANKGPQLGKLFWISTLWNEGFSRTGHWYISLFSILIVLYHGFPQGKMFLFLTLHMKPDHIPEVFHLTAPQCCPGCDLETDTVCVSELLLYLLPPGFKAWKARYFRTLLNTGWISSGLVLGQ